MSRAHSSEQIVVAGRRSSSRSAVVRSRRVLGWTFSLVAVGISVVLALLVPAAGRPPVVAGEAFVALLLGTAVAVVAERWHRSRMVDIRHHDLLEGLRHGVLPVAPSMPSEVRPPTARPSASRSAVPPGEHRLFGRCDCADCTAGQPEVADRAAESGGTGVREAGRRSVIDLRTGATRSARRPLGRRATPAG